MGIEEIHKALEAGETVYWGNLSYELRYKTCDNPNRYSQFSNKNGMSLIVRHSSGSYGGWLRERDLEKCFVNS